MLAADEQQQLIDRLQQLWMLGNAEALETKIPKEWRTMLEGEPPERQQLIVLALSAQFQSLTQLPLAPKNLKTRPPLPTLKFPVLPSNFRAIFRRLINERLPVPALLVLLAQRQYVAHPLDWLPSARDEDLPEVYWPWYRWVVDSEVKNEEDEDQLENLNADNWDLFFPAERLAQLRSLRASKPAEARQLIQDCASREPAEKRLKIMKTLSTNLSRDDESFLYELTKDRSGKIVALARSYLARLGIRSQNDENESSSGQTTDLAETFELKKVGVIKKRILLVPKALKNNKQKAIRTELLGKVTITDFASALGVAPAELANYWQYSANRQQDNLVFLTNAVDVLADKDVEVLLENLFSQLNDYDELKYLLQVILPRLSATRCDQVIRSVLLDGGKEMHFFEAIELLKNGTLGLEFSALEKSWAWKHLVKSIKEEVKDKGYIEAHAVSSELFALGLLVSQKAAKEIIASCLKLGMMGADLALDCLSLNSNLENSNTSKA